MDRNVGPRHPTEQRLKSSKTMMSSRLSHLIIIGCVGLGIAVIAGVLIHIQHQDRPTETRRTVFANADFPSSRLPDCEKCLGLLKVRSWAKVLRQIPATVIEVGELARVPYQSYRSGDYEFNVYGDPESPVSLEIGVSNEGAKSVPARKECLSVMLSILTDRKDQMTLKSLNFSEDKKTCEGLTFEVTPETAEDSYGGWWISVYDINALNASRVPLHQLAEVTFTREQVLSNPAEWTADDLKYARSVSAPPLSLNLPSQKIKPPSNSDRVYVRDYYRKDGTYVHAHTRSRPTR